MYAGTSAVVGIQDGEVKVYGVLGRGEKGLLVVDTNDRPYAKMVYRPDSEGSEVKHGTLEKTAKNEDGGTSTGKGPLDGNGSSQASQGTGSNSPSGSTNIKKTNQSKSREQSRERPSARRSPQPTLDSSKLPPLPKLPDSLRSEPERKRKAPPISIPSPPGLISQGGSAKSPGAESFNIPTPSAPSPTPMAVRPRLIIPVSPSIQPYQYPADHPISAASERSIQSVKSNESEMSTQTVRSNPRPPEDSTPYPHSGMPLSGYPKNSFNDKHIYDGQVTIANMDDAFSPTTPFEDNSPTSPRWFWRPPETLLRTPVPSGGWQPATPIGRKPEPFPWPELGLSSTERQDTVTDTTTMDGHSKWSSETYANPSSSVTKSHTIPSSGTNTAESRENFPPRPPSTKSRNASRSRNEDRSNSAMGRQGTPDEIAYRLDAISQRAESVNKMREISTNGSPLPDRPASPKSRNCSRSRPSDPSEIEDIRQMIQIGASPSIFDAEGPTTTLPVERSGLPLRPISRLSSYERRNSFTAVGSARVFSPNTGSNVPKEQFRPTSRGRQPGPKNTPATGGSALTQHPRAPSVDSVQAEAFYAQHRRIRQGMNPEQGGRRSAQEGGSRSRHSRPSLDQFERFEAIVCPTCPVHGRSSSTENNNGESSDDCNGPPNNNSPGEQQRQDLHGQSSSGRSHNAETSPDYGQSRSRGDSSSSSLLRTDSSRSTWDAVFDFGITRPRSTPSSSFNPSTPKPMKLSYDDEDLPSLVNEDFGSEDILLSRCAVPESVETLELAQSTTA